MNVQIQIQQNGLEDFSLSIILLFTYCTLLNSHNVWMNRNGALLPCRIHTHKHTRYPHAYIIVYVDYAASHLLASVIVYRCRRNCWTLMAVLWEERRSAACTANIYLYPTYVPTYLCTWYMYRTSPSHLLPPHPFFFVYIYPRARVFVCVCFLYFCHAEFLLTSGEMSCSRYMHNLLTYRRSNQQMKRCYSSTVWITLRVINY